MLQFGSTVPSPLRAVSASAQLHSLLREKIVLVELLPGTPIYEKEIAAMFGVSRTPVREALLRLADEHLVDIYPQRGTFVSRIPRGTLRDAMVLRLALEQVAVREAATRATEADIADLRRSLARQQDSETHNDMRRFHAEDESFHRRIAEIAGHPNLWRVVRQEKVQIDRCRVLHLPISSRRTRVINEHAEIVEAVARRDREAAERAMHVHLDGVLPGIEELLVAHPAYFDPQPGT